MLDSLLESRGRAIGLVACVVLLSLPIAGCFTTQAKPAPRPFTPPPIQSHVVIPNSSPVLEADMGLDLGVPVSPVEVVSIEIPRLPGPTKPPAPSPRPAPVKTTAPAPPAPTPPKIVQLFTPDQTREYNKAYDDSQDRVKKALAILEKKSLTPAQRRTMERIRTFQKQAEQEHESDLVTAVNLARRADALSADLVTRLQ